MDKTKKKRLTLKVLEQRFQRLSKYVEKFKPLFEGFEHTYRFYSYRDDRTAEALAHLSGRFDAMAGTVKDNELKMREVQNRLRYGTPIGSIPKEDMAEKVLNEQLASISRRMVDMEVGEQQHIKAHESITCELARLTTELERAEKVRISLGDQLKELHQQNRKLLKAFKKAK